MPKDWPIIRRRRRAKLRRRGDCIGDCGRKATPRSPRCAECRAANAKASRASYDRKVRDGECIKCPAKARPGKRTCQGCADAAAEQKERRKIRREYAAADAAQIAAIVTSRPGEGAYG